MVNSILFECATGYLYNCPRPVYPIKKEEPKKVAGVVATRNGKRFNLNADVKSNHTHIDICI